MPGRKTQVLPETDPERLDMPPHVLPQLIDMMTGDWQPGPPDLELLLTHLVACLHCQIALATLIALELESNLSSEAAEALRKLLTRLTTIIHETQAQHALGAYIELFEAQGEDEANNKFPVLAHHLKRCKACQSTLAGTRT
jgi:hypothetical protein